MKILKHLFGETEAATTDELLEMAGRALDHACTSELNCSFIGEDGKVYVLTVEACISRAADDHAVELLTGAMLAEKPAEPVAPIESAPADDRLLRTPNGGRLPRTVRELVASARNGLAAIRRCGRPDYDGTYFIRRYGKTPEHLIDEYRNAVPQDPGYWVFASRLGETLRRVGGFDAYRLLPGAVDPDALVLSGDGVPDAIVQFEVPEGLDSGKPIYLSTPELRGFMMFSGDCDLLQVLCELGIRLPGEGR